MVKVKTALDAEHSRLLECELTVLRDFGVRIKTSLVKKRSLDTQMVAL